MNRGIIQYVSPDKLECDPQIREQFSERELLGLARSIQEIGIQQPVRARRDGERLVVVVGERRLRAAVLAKQREVPVIVEEKPLCEGEVLHRQLVENLQRAELLPTERAKALKRLIETTGWQIKEAAGKCGLSASTATKLLSVLDLAPEIQSQIDAGEVPLSSGYDLKRVMNPEKQAALAQKVAEGTLSRDGLSEAVKEAVSEGARESKREVKRIALLTGAESVTVAGPGLTLERVVAVLEELLAKARRSRTRGVDLKSFARSLRKKSAVA